jgi:isoquinoline 1-oxidoreductase beta subunit
MRRTDRADLRMATRRDFLKQTTLLAGGLVIGFAVRGALRPAFGQSEQDPTKFPPNAFIRIAPDNTVTVLLKHAEMGQGVWTSIPLCIAEELDCDWQNIRVEHAPVAPPYVHTAYGVQLTDGSSSTRESFDQMRTAGAAARTMLVRAAAARWGLSEEQCRVADGYVLSADQRLSYGELTTEAEKLPVPSHVSLKEPAQWKYLGKPTRRLDLQAKITGQAQYGIDVVRPGMLTAVIARCPVLGGTLKSYRAEQARSVPGVVDVFQVPSGVAVVARHFWAAKRGRDTLEIDWEPGEGASLSSSALRQQYQAAADTPGKVAKTKGDYPAALQTADRRLAAEYEVPYLAHAAMEPLNCVVEINNELCEVWTGTQSCGQDQRHLMKAFGLQAEQVRIHTMFMGGGFGRRDNPHSDYVVEAAQVAKKAGRPVKVVWTREDDISGGFYRPMWLSRLSAGTDAQGNPIAWKHTLVGQNLAPPTDEPEDMAVEGAADSPYLEGIPDHRVELHSPKNNITVQWMRSVGNAHTAFAIESFVDELAHAAGVDSVEYRRRLLRGQPRHLGVLNLAAEKFGWGKPLAQGRAAGVALHYCRETYVAEIAEVSIVKAAVRVHRVVCAVDCGVAINPLAVEAQMQSSIVFGLSAALHSELTFQDGRTEQTNFNTYRVLRLNEMPHIDVHILNSGAKVGGIGEPGVPPIAPAVANAVFALTGKRLRRLPLRLV